MVTSRNNCPYATLPTKALSLKPTLQRDHPVAQQQRTVIEVRRYFHSYCCMCIYLTTLKAPQIIASNYRIIRELRI